MRELRGKRERDKGVIGELEMKSNEMQLKTGKTFAN